MIAMGETILLNQVYDRITVQGEGPFIGRPCTFVRTQGCPVKCPGCDEAPTWDGSTKGTAWKFEEVTDRLQKTFVEWPHAGVVLTGGEPLIHFRNTELAYQLPHWRKNWLSLETSGFVGPKPIESKDQHSLFRFLSYFDSVSLSPKVTPCLRGPDWGNGELLCNIGSILSALSTNQLFLKFVVRDDADVRAVLDFRNSFGHRYELGQLYVMPYGITRDEVLRGCEYLVPVCAKEGFILTPRLHVLIWGNERGR